jgi:hypothetical protein
MDRLTTLDRTPDFGQPGAACVARCLSKAKKQPLV